MKVLHLSHTDAGAGAGGAAYRIHKALLELGTDSRMIVADKRTGDATVLPAIAGRWGRMKGRLCAYLEAKLARRLAPHGFISPSVFAQFRPNRDARVRAADVVCLYWINGGFVRPEGLAGLAQPLVWRLSDVWPFSGGCHYPGACAKYTQQCGSCPKLENTDDEDHTRRLFLRKQRHWAGLNVTLVAPSRWIADCARRSSLFARHQTVVIPTGVDLQRFRPAQKSAARAQLRLPPDRKLILFAALQPSFDARKGHAFLSDALKAVASGPLGPRCVAVLAGDAGAGNRDAFVLPSVNLGYLSQEASMALAYAAADVVVVPSLEDNLPNVAIEAIACGTPVVGFNVGGMPDIVRHQENGFLAEDRDATGLAAGIEWVLHDDDRYRALSRHARHVAEQDFDLQRQARTYHELYRRLIDGSRRAVI